MRRKHEAMQPLLGENLRMPMPTWASYGFLMCPNFSVNVKTILNRIHNRQIAGYFRIFPENEGNIFYLSRSIAEIQLDFELLVRINDLDVSLRDRN